MNVFDLEARRRVLAAVTGAAFGVAAPLALGLSAAHATSGDWDDDGMPNRWEKRHALDPREANARADQDRDGLVNIREYRNGADPGDEDTDEDGHDDGDEVMDGVRTTDVDDADTDGDRVPDGDEDYDRDGIDNEDEDDAAESCRGDDDDDDDDHVDDEDEDELSLVVGVTDSDGDGVVDGDEDEDADGESNEDEDDDDQDRCGSHGDEDDGDRFGMIVAFDGATGQLTIEAGAGAVVYLVTAETEIAAGDEDGSTADLLPGAVVEEIGIDDDSGALEEVELAGADEAEDDEA